MKKSRSTSISECANAGRVVSVTAESAVVEVDRSSACSGCGAAAACHPLGVGTRMRALARNRAGARPGDLVRLEVTPATLLGASAAVYVLPLGGFFGGMILGSLLEAARTSATGSGLGAAAGGFAGLALSLVVLRAIDRRLQRTRRSLVVVARVLEPAADRPNGAPETPDRPPMGSRHSPQ